MANILAADDEQSILRMLDMHLSLAGHVCFPAKDAAAARDILARETIQVALLDIMMPGEDGFSLAEAFIQRDIPVLFLTAKTAVTDRVKGLRLGADDYILKPFEPAELLARIEAILRRVRKGEAPYEDARLQVDYQARRVLLRGEEVALTALEFDLLALLTKEVGHAVSRETLLHKVWGYAYIGETRTVDAHVQRLRAKIGADAVETVYKYGYRYQKAEEV